MTLMTARRVEGLARERESCFLVFWSAASQCCVTKTVQATTPDVYRAWTCATGCPKSNTCRLKFLLWVPENAYKASIGGFHNQLLSHSQIMNFPRDRSGQVKTTTSYANISWLMINIHAIKVCLAAWAYMAAYSCLVLGSYTSHLQTLY